MKCFQLNLISLLLTAGAGAATEHPLTIPVPTTFSSLLQPSEEVTLPESYMKVIAQQAYICGWPMVNQFNRRETITKAPYPVLNGGMVPVAPMGQLSILTDYIKPEETFVTCPNQDVASGLGYLELDKGPIVIQMTNFGKSRYVRARAIFFNELQKTPHSGVLLGETDGQKTQYGKHHWVCAREIDKHRSHEKWAWL